MVSAHRSHQIVLPWTITVKYTENKWLNCQAWFYFFSSGKTISKLKADLEEAEDLMVKERDEAKLHLEKRLREESSKLLRESSEKIEQLETELAEFRVECERLKQLYSEDSVLAETEKQQALMMAQQVWLLTLTSRTEHYGQSYFVVAGSNHSSPQPAVDFFSK